MIRVVLPNRRHGMKKPKFTTYAWLFLGYLLFVILFGAWVRITHSGAGCGSHWPTCHGEVVPLAPTTETIIEYTHRLTSGLLGIFALVLVGWAFARHRGRVFAASVVTLVLIIFEALIGAQLVLQELVADDASVARAIVIALHLANTLILTAAASLTAWWSGTDARLEPSRHRGLLALGALSLVVLVATSMTGAVTALGDTLFPVDPTLGGGLVDRVRTDLGSAQHFLVRLRIIHPVVAVLGGLWLIVYSFVVRARDLSPAAHRWATALFALVLTQLAVGFANIALSAPGWMQLAHLLFAQVVWIAAVLTTVSTFEER